MPGYSANELDFALEMQRNYGAPEAGIPARDTCFDALTHGFLVLTGLSPGSRAAAARIAREIDDALRTGQLP